MNVFSKPRGATIKGPCCDEGNLTRKPGHSSVHP